MKERRSVNFARNVVRGKIAETIFAQMLRDTKEFTVLEFGYEKTMPGFSWKDYDSNSETFDILRTTPDFAVLNQRTGKVQLVEVKWRKKITPSVVKAIATKMSASWKPSSLFLASTDGFYFDDVSTIIKNKGKIKKLRHPQILVKLQEEYLAVLNDFESASTNNV